MKRVPCCEQTLENVGHILNKPDDPGTPLCILVEFGSDTKNQFQANSVAACLRCRLFPSQKGLTLERTIVNIETVELNIGLSISNAFLISETAVFFAKGKNVKKKIATGELANLFGDKKLKFSL